MGTVRPHLRRHRIRAMWLFAAAMLMKVLVPAGYMPALYGGSVVIEMCSGFGPETMAMAMPGMADHHGKSDRSGRSDMPCGFAGHAPASMAGADPILLVVALAFIVASVVGMPASRAVRRPGNLRPPLRGPPAIR